MEKHWVLQRETHWVLHWGWQKEKHWVLQRG